jgi:hypothetical protein
MFRMARRDDLPFFIAKQSIKRIRIFRYSFHSFRCCLDFRIIRITALQVFLAN